MVSASWISHLIEKKRGIFQYENKRNWIGTPMVALIEKSKQKVNEGEAHIHYREDKIIF